MRTFATRGDVYSFAGIPTITYIAFCAHCPQPRAYKEFGSVDARNTWLYQHEDDWPDHNVAILTEVTA